MIVTIPMRRSVRKTVRWTAALAVSLSCHALLLAMLPMLGGVAFPPERPIAVTLLGGGGGGSGGQGDGTGGAPPGSEALAPVTVPVEETKPAPVERLAALAPPAPVPPPRPRAEAPRRGTARPTSSHREIAPEPAAPDASGSGNGSGAAAAPGGGGDGAGSGMGEGAGSGMGEGGGTGPGHGTGTGRGDGSGDLRASCTSCPAPEYPARARRQGWQGTVDVEVRVGGDGAVQNAQVGRSSGFPALDTAAVNVARQSRFRVAGGTAVSGQLRYRFVLEAGERPL
jgi:protein TonB